VPDDVTASAYALKLSDVELNRYRLMAEVARTAEADMWQMAGIVGGARVADIGCGPGAMLPVLSEAVGTTGQIVAVDADPDAVAAASALIAAAGLANVTVTRADAAATGLTPTSFDAVMTRHVLAHNGPREQIIVDHLATLLRPGGCLFIVDVDGGAMRLRPTEPEFEEMNEAYRRFHASLGNDLEVGLRLGGLLEAAGLEVIEFRGRYQIISAPPGLRPPPWAAREAMVAAGFATAADIERWDAALNGVNAVPRTLFAPQFSAVGRRPA
jgi:SAM-dependent methyltransferase